MLSGYEVFETVPRVVIFTEIFCVSSSSLRWPWWARPSVPRAHGTTSPLVNLLLPSVSSFSASSWFFSISSGCYWVYVTTVWCGTNGDWKTKLWNSSYLFRQQPPFQLSSRRWKKRLCEARKTTNIGQWINLNVLDPAIRGLYTLYKFLAFYWHLDSRQIEILWSSSHLRNITFEVKVYIWRIEQRLTEPQALGCFLSSSRIYVKRILQKKV